MPPDTENRRLTYFCRQRRVKNRFSRETNRFDPKSNGPRRILVDGRRIDKRHSVIIYERDKFRQKKPPRRGRTYR